MILFGISKRNNNEKRERIRRGNSNSEWAYATLKHTTYLAFEEILFIARESIMCITL